MSDTARITDPQYISVPFFGPIAGKTKIVSGKTGPSIRVACALGSEQRRVIHEGASCLEPAGTPIPVSRDGSRGTAAGLPRIGGRF